MSDRDVIVIALALAGLYLSWVTAKRLARVEELLARPDAPRPSVERRIAPEAGPAPPVPRPSGAMILRLPPLA